MKSTKFELVLDLKTANTLNIELPPGPLAIADEVPNENSEERFYQACRRRGGSVAARPAREQADRMRRIGWLDNGQANGPGVQARSAAVRQFGAELLARRDLLRRQSRREGLAAGDQNRTDRFHQRREPVDQGFVSGSGPSPAPTSLAYPERTIGGSGWSCAHGDSAERQPRRLRVQSEGGAICQVPLRGGPESIRSIEPRASSASSRCDGGEGKAKIIWTRKPIRP
jgi:hypothetical protein